MQRADLARLLALAVLWGASFLLFRVIVPSLGVVVTSEVRVLVAGFVLLAWQRVTKQPFAWRPYRTPLVVVGVFNSALPFALFAFAARTLPAGYLAILNATAPLFGAVIARAWLRDPLGVRRTFGVLCGIAGVAALVRLGPIAIDAHVLVACAACLVGAASYGFASNYTKQLASPVPPMTMATGSQLAAAALLLPLLPFDPLHAVPTIEVIGAVAILAIASTAVAYLLYFRLIRDIGATRALTVTFLVPLSAIGWGWAVLGEAPTPRMAIGGLLVIVATFLVVRSTAATPALPRTPSATS